MVSLQNGGPSVNLANDGMANLSVANGTAEPAPGPAAMVAVGSAKSVSLPAPDLSKVKAVDTHTRALGIIQPPPDIRAIVDKSATFVAKNGVSFESKILEQQQNNPKFNFLRPTDPYHAYYRWKVTEEQKLAEGGPSTAAQQKQQAADVVAASQQPIQLPASVAPAKPLEPPEPDQYTVRTPEGLTAEHLDIIKLTAQCVARNGQSFLTGLIGREQGNPTFLFLKPTHSLFGYFKDLCDAYSRTLMPPKELMAKLKRDAADRTALLERCLRRLEWEKQREAEEQEAADKAEAERLAMQSIDWHDFVVVETIDFFDDEDAELPPPMTQRDVVLLNRAGAFEEEEAAKTAGGEAGKGQEDTEMDDEEKAMVAEANAAAGAPAVGQQPPAPPAPPQTDMQIDADDEEPMRIVKNYQRPSTRPGQPAAGMAISPITGELVPVAEMAEHMRISLIDPRWRTEREAMLAKIRETTQASDDEISRNLVDLAGHRPDVFGSTQEEVGAIVKASIDDKKISGNDRPISWDGQTRSGPGLHNQLNAISDNKVDLKRKEMDGPSVPQPILGPRPPTGTALPPPPTIRPPTVASLPPPPVRPPTIPPPAIPPPQPLRPPVALPPPIPVAQRPPPMGMAPPARPGMPPMMQMPPPVLQPPPMGMAPPQQQSAPAGMPAPPSAPAPPPVPSEDAPDAKRQRVDFVLQDETEFLQQHPGPSKVRIVCPDTDENANLNGQVLEVEVASLATPVGELKARLAEVLGLPPNKQQLSREHFRNMRDNLTLAHFNILPSVEVALGIRKRGGR